MLSYRHYAGRPIAERWTYMASLLRKRMPRGNDHFPFTGFASDANSPDIFTGSSVSTSQFIAAANSASPPNFLWFTPTDNHNMHDNSVQTGDSYLKTFLVGSGTVLTPTSGSLLASSLFRNSQYRTLLYLWW